ncbi:two-component regulator propeller domain-containing protein [Saccharicrinis sp. FJH54]|uniref:hybrid sensor histidine kinase/response regulator transcription factor n=1 Tax=Saccharicrinis sp. FJH54 TaxID=3344665 RepID=UPI0035D49419
MKILKPIILVLFGILIQNIYANSRYSFLRLNNSNGLINNQVTCIFKDSHGFIWIGTSAGLSRYDGSKFINFKHNLNDSTTIIDNYIVKIKEDRTGKLWIKTRWEYVVYDIEKEKFIPNIKKLIGDENNIEALKEVYSDEDRNIWFTHNQVHGIEMYNDSTGEPVTPFGNQTLKASQIVDFKDTGNRYYLVYSNGTIDCFTHNFKLKYRDTFLNGKTGIDSLNLKLFIDTDRDLWLYGNNEGLYHRENKSGIWHNYTINSDILSLSSNLIVKVIQDDKGLIWVGTDHGGIDIFNKYSKKVETVYHQPGDDKSLSQNSITDLFIDNNNIIWVGTYKKGVCYYHESIYKFPHYHNFIPEQYGLSYNDVNCFAEDAAGNLWIGTNGSGLIRFNRTSNAYKLFKNDPANPNSLSNNVVVSLFFDSDSLLFIGTYTGGLNVYDGRNFTRYKARDGLPNESIWTITEDNLNRIWIGTLGGGIVLFDKLEHKLRPLENKGNVTLPSNFVNHIYKMHDGTMFIGTAVGVAFYNIDESRYRNHPVKNANVPLRISNNNVNAVFEDSRGLLWIATREGLTVADPNSDFIKYFDEDDNLPTDIMNCILEDEFQSVWVSKSSGLSQIVVSQSEPGESYDFKVYNYTEADGLQGREYNANARLKTKNNELIFGGPNGFNLFQSQNIKYNNLKPKIVFTDFQIFNSSVKPDEEIKNRVILTKSITFTDKITLKYAMNLFSIEFAALDFFIPEKVRYQYMLEGFDRDWIDAEDNIHKVTYTNLNAGKYTFRVKASNNDNQWSNEATSLSITVLPPVYASPLAYIIYAVIILLLIVYFRYSMIRKERLRLKIEHDKLMAKRHHEMDEMKLRFLTNVSHEFRTPLTLILSPVEKLIRLSKNTSDKKLLELIDSNARHLLALVNQLLDFRKLDLHGLRYNPSYGDIVAFIRKVFDNFSDSFRKKNITYKFKSGVNQFNKNFDHEKVQKIMMNLLSNALKFTPENGKVEVSVEITDGNPDEQQMVVIKVKDNGVGIPEEEKDKIFERFYQSQNHKELGLSGSGIGLNLVREMVSLHNGTITVESEKDKGSVFIVTLPAGTGESIDIQTNTEAEISTDATEVPEDIKQNGKQVVLLAEDNPELRRFMKETLQDRYTVKEAGDGDMALKLANKYLPDLIISDVMMPKLDGLDLCKRLKNDIHTSHIPVILLTARTADEDKIKGLEIGADDYITKPFNLEMLLLRIHNLMDKRQNMHQHFRKNIAINPSEIEITSLDEKLIKKAVDYVEKNLSQSRFSVEDLSRELGMSRVYLYKKLLTITGKSPVEFIRIIRLKRGAQLLEKSQMTIAEIAYEVGFNSPRYFSKYFKEEYGMLPTDYVKKHT